MNVASTRGGAAELPLGDALLGGTAPDGGLFVPASFPRGEARNPRGGSLADSALAVLAPFFAGDTLEPELPAMVAEAFTFPAPLVPLRNRGDFMVELFHGPTAAFKDFGARFLAACGRRLHPPSHGTRIVLVATSGDTGAAVAAAFHRMPGVRVVLLYPDGRVSPRQAHQLGAFADNVTALRVAGAFDDCQAMVKSAFADPELASLRLTSANSISLGRLLPQLAYHAHAAWSSGGTLNLVVPTGNLGNALAALWARELGAPVGDVVLATNANQTLPEFFQGGVYRGRPSVPTLANAMDVGDPSNFERLAWMFPDPAVLRRRVRARSASDEHISRTIQQGERRHGQVFCPHTAAGVWVLEQIRSAAGGGIGAWAVVATAHPAKFEGIVEPLVGHRVDVPPALAELLTRPSRAERLAADPGALRRWLLDHADG
ncbi:MAG: threonine synthase [Myxococcaceae bacterium]|nr:MAG: threonine synthase [Myxococcaceae bacterium]